MKYKVIFSKGYMDDSEALMKGYKSDILLLDEKGKYFELNFIELEVIKNGFEQEKVCYLENNMIILHAVTKENILKSITELHQWKFFLRWMPLSVELVEKYYYPKEDWVIFEVTIESTV